MAPSLTAQSIDLPERGLCAHRGAMTSHPENTLPAFQEAIRVGAQMIEFDVQLSSDSALVVMHDGTVDRTTNGTGNVADMTLAAIKALDAGSWKSAEFKGVKVPVLEEVLAIMPRNIWLNIHIKGGEEAGRRVAREVVKANRLEQTVLAVTKAAREGARKEEPGILICNMERQSGGLDYVEGTIEMDAHFIQLRGEIKPNIRELTQKLKKTGIKINFFGTDNPKELAVLFQLGVDFPLVNDITSSMETAVVLGIAPVLPE